MTPLVLILAAFGLMLVLEGLAYAAAPDAMRNFAARVANMSSEDLRTGGLIAGAVGLVIAWVCVRFLT